MQVPENITQFDIVLSTIVTDDETREMVMQFVREEYQRGYLFGKNEMKTAAENAISKLRP